MDGAEIDGQWYLDLVRLTDRTSWLRDVSGFFSTWGLPLVVLLVAVSWWWMRSRSAARMAGAVWSLVAALLGYGLNYLVKVLVREVRPCHRFPDVPTAAPCDPVTDYAFPSNHATAMAAAAVALFAVGVLPAVTASALTLLVGVSRVAQGIHYPHDILAGCVLGALVACLGLLARRQAAGWIERWRASGMRVLVASARTS